MEELLLNYIALGLLFFVVIVLFYRIIAIHDIPAQIAKARHQGTQLALRPGVYVVPMPFRPAMVFVNDSQRDRALAAAFQPNALQRVLAGDEAEVLFKGIPGRVFKTKVRLAIDAIAGGQLQTTGTIREVGATLPEDRAPALLDIVDDMSSYQVPLGSSGEAAIYAHHFARAVFVAENTSARAKLAELSL